MKKIILVNDISSLGRCSLSVQLPLISALQINAIPFPTMLLTAQTGIKNHHIFPLDTIIDDYIKDLSSINSSAMLIGFMNEKILTKVSILCNNYKNIILIDPIIGDKGKLFEFVSDSYLKKIKNLVKKADIITPNLTEFCYITGLNYDLAIQSLNNNIKEGIKLLVSSSRHLQEAGISQIVITGIRYKNFVHNLLIEKNCYFITKNKFTNTSYSGTGDMFCALYLGYIIKGIKPSIALKKSASFIEKCVKKTLTNPKYGVNFETNLRLIN